MNNIIYGYTNDKGITYDNIRDVHFYQKSELMNNVGKFKAESSKENNRFFASSLNKSDGVYIYQTHYDPKKALRIFKDYADYKYTYHNDDKLISELQKRQPNIKLTEFPTGIVTVENKIIGQEIPYYDDSETIFNLLKNGKLNKKINSNIIILYSNVINILKELINNGIIYTDVHPKNFMINLETMVTNLIDFEPDYILFEEKKDSQYKSMFRNLKDMLIYINKAYNINFDETFDKTTDLEELEEYINEKKYQLTK